MKIGFFDSGIGGISVMAAVAERVGAEFIYYADTLNVPFGNKSAEEIAGFSERGAAFLKSLGADAIVVACNTATGYGIEKLRRDRSDIKFFGVEPAVKPAFASEGGGDILILVTEATARQESFLRLLARYGDRRAVLAPQRDLARVIEENYPYAVGKIREEIDKLRIYRGVSAVVLGCTHYVLVKEDIRRIFPAAELYDGNAGTANRIGSVLGSRSDKVVRPPRPAFYFSGKEESERYGEIFLRQAGKYMLK